MLFFNGTMPRSSNGRALLLHGRDGSSILSRGTKSQEGWAVYLANEDKVVYLSLGIMEGKGCHHIKPGRYEEYGGVP